MGFFRENLEQEGGRIVNLQANENILWLMLGLALLLLWVTIIMLRGENERTTLEQSQKRLRIIDAFSQAYAAIMLVQLREGTVEVLKSVKGTTKEYNEVMTTEAQWGQIRRFAAESYKKAVMAFCDMTTIEERLQGHPTLSYTWQTAAGGWMQTLLVPQRYDSKGKLRAVLVANRDVTEEKERELAAQHQAEAAAEEARRANAAKTDFLRRMSHDLRTPINGIRGMVEISRHYAGDEAKQEECREKIMEASGFLLDLVNNVLDMNKLESGEIQLEQVPFDLEELLQETVNVVEVQAARAPSRIAVSSAVQCTCGRCCKIFPATLSSIPPPAARCICPPGNWMWKGTVPGSNLSAPTTASA